MEPTSALGTFLSTIGTVFTSLIDWVGTVTTGLLTNEIFIIIMAVILFLLFFGLVVGLAKSVRSRKKGKK